MYAVNEPISSVTFLNNTPQVTQPACFGGLGSITWTVGGGLLPYTFSIQNLTKKS